MARDTSVAKNGDDVSRQQKRQHDECALIKATPRHSREPQFAEMPPQVFLGLLGGRNRVPSSDSLIMSDRQRDRVRANPSVLHVRCRVLPLLVVVSRTIILRLFPTGRVSCVAAKPRGRSMAAQLAKRVRDEPGPVSFGWSYL